MIFITHYPLMSQFHSWWLPPPFRASFSSAFLSFFSASISELSFQFLHNPLLFSLPLSCRYLHVPCTILHIIIKQAHTHTDFHCLRWSDGPHWSITGLIPSWGSHPAPAHPSPISCTVKPTCLLLQCVIPGIHQWLPRTHWEKIYSHYHGLQGSGFRVILPLPHRLYHLHSSLTLLKLWLPCCPCSMVEMLLSRVSVGPSTLTWYCPRSDSHNL